jgi:hypothetical protein
VTPLMVDMTNVRALKEELRRFDVEGVERAESVPPPSDIELWPAE